MSSQEGMNTCNAADAASTTSSATGTGDARAAARSTRRSKRKRGQKSTQAKKKARGEEVVAVESGEESDGATESQGRFQLMRTGRGGALEVPVVEEEEKEVPELPMKFMEKSTLNVTRGILEYSLRVYHGEDTAISTADCFKVLRCGNILKSAYFEQLRAVCLSVENGHSRPFAISLAKLRACPDLSPILDGFRAHPKLAAHAETVKALLHSLRRLDFFDSNGVLRTDGPPIQLQIVSDADLPVHAAMDAQLRTPAVPAAGVRTGGAGGAPPAAAAGAAASGFGSQSTAVVPCVFSPQEIAEYSATAQGRNMLSLLLVGNTTLRQMFLSDMSVPFDMVWKIFTLQAADNRARLERESVEKEKRLDREAEQAIMKIKVKAEKDAQDAEKVLIELKLQAEKDAQDAEKVLIELKLKAEKEAQDAKLKAEKEAQDAKVKAEKDAQDAKLKAEKDAQDLDRALDDRRLALVENEAKAELKRKDDAEALRLRLENEERERVNREKEEKKVQREAAQLREVTSRAYRLASTQAGNNAIREYFADWPQETVRALKTDTMSAYIYRDPVQRMSADRIAADVRRKLTEVFPSPERFRCQASRDYSSFSRIRASMELDEDGLPLRDAISKLPADERNQLRFIYTSTSRPNVFSVYSVPLLKALM